MTTPAAITAYCADAADDITAYLEDPQAQRQEVLAARTCRVLLSGLSHSPEDLLEDHWNAVLFTLEALHLADTVGRPASHVYRRTYRALTGHLTTDQEG